ncbi:hypothetical protein Mapa_014427 [Marchantia paleacea]|nr:hypothetical protein Mapa_014427 [Marchantia paleacea]
MNPYCKCATRIDRSVPKDERCHARESRTLASDSDIRYRNMTFSDTGSNGFERKLEHRSARPELTRA